MKYSDIKLSIKEQFKNSSQRVPFYIEGKPGGGKSALAQDIGRDPELGYDNVFQFYASLRDPVDLLGTPAPDEHVTRWRPPEELQVLSKGRNLLIVEELSDALTPMQNALCGLIYDGKVGNVTLSDDTDIIATGNRTQDKSGANRVVSKLMGRVRLMEFDENIHDWASWAFDANIDPILIQFLRYRPDLLSDFDPNRKCNPTPRTWARASLIPSSLPTDVFFTNVAGDVGESAAAEYTGFRRIWEQLPPIEGILLNPSKADVPTDPAVLFAVTGALSRQVSKDNFDRVMEYMNRLPGDFQVMAVQDAVRIKPEVKMTKAFIGWAVTNANVLL